jgi:hypothetical protein
MASEGTESTSDAAGIIAGRVARFRGDLASFDAGTLVQRHITTGSSYLLDEAQYHLLRARVAAEFGLHANEILVVGSAKLGFSIVKEKRYRAFGEESDIDVAIVSSSLFDEFARATFDFWRQQRYWTRYQKYVEYQFRGWIRPDYLPNSLARGQAWWEFFRRLTSEGLFGPYQIKAGLYKSWHYLDSYHAVCIEECRRSEPA